MEEYDSKELEEILSLISEPESLEKKLISLLKELHKLRNNKYKGDSEDENQTNGNDDQQLFEIDVSSDGNMLNKSKSSRNSKTLSSNYDDEFILGSEETPEKPNKKGGCFNCEGDHNLSDCPKPKNHKVIARNRQQFFKMQSTMSSKRYHVDEAQLFSHITPGLPSEKLREALRLDDDQLPSYIYRMRTFGYPPGWLEEAAIKRSDMSLYIDEDNTIGNLEDEDGQISDKIVYDKEKIIKWPGFNENLPETESYTDETRLYRCPKLNETVAKFENLGEEVQKGYVKGEMQEIKTELDSTEDSDEPQTKRLKLDDESRKNDDLQTNIVQSQMSGTPIITNYSSYESLPNQKKWAEGTTDVVFFENIPDYTGKWDQMKEVLKKTRKTISQIQ